MVGSRRHRRRQSARPRLILASPEAGERRVGVPFFAGSPSSCAKPIPVRPMFDGTVPTVVDALSLPEAYGGGKQTVALVETHMSWVFLVGDRAYKLKKSLRLPYLDFSTLEKREAACRAELELNRRLAEAVYLGVEPIRLSTGGLRIGGEEGRIVDWLVVMKRLDDQHALEHALRSHAVVPRTVFRLENTLAAFYRRVRPARLPHYQSLSQWYDSLRTNREILLRFHLPVTAVSRTDRAQRAFLQAFGRLILERHRARQVLDGHGDLRPEHIFTNETVSIIDCLEFNAQLRAVDPFEEAAFLAIECERHGSAWVGEHVIRRLSAKLPRPAPPALITFYKSYRATVRARLSIAHLLEPKPRTPEKWLPPARRYLAIADRHAAHLETMLKRHKDPSGRAHRATA